MALTASCRRRTVCSRSPSITGPNSYRARWKIGRISEACSSISFGLESRWKMRSESFNGRLRDECLNVHQFTSIEDAKAKRSKRGASITISAGHTARSGI